MGSSTASSSSKARPVYSPGRCDYCKERPAFKVDGNSRPICRRCLSHPPLRIDGVKIGRNSPCPCGSGEKFKRCCISRPHHDLQRIQQMAGGLR